MALLAFLFYYNVILEFEDHVENIFVLLHSRKQEKKELWVETRGINKGESTKTIPATRRNEIPHD